MVAQDGWKELLLLRKLLSSDTNKVGVEAVIRLTLPLATAVQWQVEEKEGWGGIRTEVND